MRISKTATAIAAVIAVLSVGFTTMAAGTGPKFDIHLVRDITTTPMGSDPQGFVSIGNRVLFQATGADQQQELWVTNGTAAGTHILSLGGSYGDLLQMAPAGNDAYFGAQGPNESSQVWKSDGTQHGTVMIKSWPKGMGGANTFTAVGSTVYFVSGNGHTGALWRSNGTPGGTRMIRTILLGPGSGYHFNLPGLTAAGKTIYFEAYSAAAGRELWKSDGTTAGTMLLKDINRGPHDSNFQPLASLGNILYFSANDGVHGTELWRTDGTVAGTRMVKDIAPDSPSLGIQSSNPSQMIVAGKEVFFLACSRVPENRTRCDHPGAIGPNEIWKSDGTAAGTVEVKQISVFENLEYLGPDAHGKPIILFDGWDHAHGFRVWRSDGTPAGTQILAGFPFPDPSYLTPLGTAHPLAVFVGYGSGKNQLWATDGTAAGTRLLARAEPAYLTPATLRGKPGVIFSGADSATSSQPWFSDGTPSGTAMIKRVNMAD